MKNFFILYCAPTESIEAMMEGMSPDDMEVRMEEWNEWMDEHRDNIVDVGAPLGKTKRVNAARKISEAKNEVTGYGIISADTHAEAAELLKDHPHLEIKGAYIDVLDIVEMSANI